VVEEEEEESERDESIEDFYKEHAESQDYGSENFTVDDDEAEAEGVQESKRGSATGVGADRGSARSSLYAEDRAYVMWLKKWGAVDFSHMPFLPRVWSNEQLRAYARIMRVQDERRVRAKQIRQGLSVQEIDQVDPRSRLGAADRHQHFWFLDAEQYAQFEADHKLLETPERKIVLAKRFDFVFNDNYYILNVQLDNNGCGLIGRSNYS